MKNLFSVCLFAFLAISFAAEIAEEDGVLVLTTSNFDEAIASNQHILVEFYAPWCGHCKKLAPEYASAAQALKNEGSAVRLAKVDATVESSLGGRFEVRGYPTLKFFINGSPVNYEGGRTSNEIVNWLKKKTLPSTLEVHDLDSFQNYIDRNEVVVAFFGDSSHADWSVFERVSKQFDDVIFVYTTDAPTKHKFAGSNSIKLFKKFDEREAEFEGEANSESIANFIREHQFPTVMGFDQKIAQKIFSDSQPALFLVIENNEEGQRASEALKALGSRLKGKLYLSISNIDEGLGGRLAEFVGITRSELPAIRLLRITPGANPSKFKFNNEITSENIFEFWTEFQAGRLRPYLKSEPVPQTQEGHVKVVVGESFDDVVLAEDDDVLIEFYAPWCGHCKSLAPAYEEAAKRLSSVRNLVIAKCDATANEVEGVQIQGYPTIKFYPAGKKNSPVDFDGGRDADGIVNWIKSHAVGAKFPEGSDEL